METHPGHNRSMQCWRLNRGGKTMFGFADLVPMRAHVRLPWIMGYDLYPVETLKQEEIITAGRRAKIGSACSTTILMRRCCVRFVASRDGKGVQSREFLIEE